MSRIMKKIVLTLISFLVICEMCMAALVTDNDGAAFITKSEFDSLKNDFQSQIDVFNRTIDSTIDKAISEYLAGISNKSSGTFDPVDIENYANIEWRDKLIWKGTMRTFNSATSYSTAAGTWEATYDTILCADNNFNPRSATEPVFLVWSTFAPYGYGGIEVIFKADMPSKGKDGNVYWRVVRSGTTYFQPNFPLIYYKYDEYNKNDKKNCKRLKGWREFGACFTGITSGECDCSKTPDGTQYLQSNAWGNNMNTLNGIRQAKSGTAGRDSNCFGIELFNASGGRLGGIRPTKASTEYFPMWRDIYNYHSSRATYETSFPRSYPQLGSSGSDGLSETNAYLCKMMLGSENTQEVNYIIDSTAQAFWTNNILWPEDCFRDFELTNFQMRKVPIYANPSANWQNGRSDTASVLPIDTLFSTAYQGVFQFDVVPDKLTVSLPTKPHKRLKELETNFFSADGDVRLKFGDGLPIVRNNYFDCEVTVDFDVIASTTSYTPYMQIRKGSFNSTADDAVITTNSLLPSSTDKYVIHSGHNKIKFKLKKEDREAWARFSPGDNSGENYLKISNVVANYETVE